MKNEKLTIWKYELRPDGATESIPEGFKVLDVQAQRGTVCVWCLVDPSAPRIMSTFRCYGTGNDVPNEIAAWEHVGTFQLEGGALVFHAFMAPGGETFAQGAPN